MATTIITAMNTYARVTQASVPSAYPVPGATPSLNKPSTAILYDQTNASQSPNLIRFIPFSSITNGTNVGVRLLGWTRYTSSTTGVWWMPTVLADFTLAYSTSGLGVPLLTIETSNDTALFNGITQVAGTPNSYAYSPATSYGSVTRDTATGIVDATGTELVQAQFKSSGTPTMGIFYTTL